MFPTGCHLDSAIDIFGTTPYIGRTMKPPQPFDLQPILVGDTLVLRPLRPGDLEPLHQVAADPLIWEQHPDRLRHQWETFERKFFPAALASGGALAVEAKATGGIIGTSRYYEWNPAEKSVAIGYTFLARAFWGGVTNREMKRLMLEHAFQWADVVWFHIGSNNRRSRAALEKIGGVFSHEEPWEVNGALEAHAFYKIEKSR